MRPVIRLPLWKALTKRTYPPLLPALFFRGNNFSRARALCDASKILTPSRIFSSIPCKDDETRETEQQMTPALKQISKNVRDATEPIIAENNFNIPNFLSVSRIVATPFLCYMILNDAPQPTFYLFTLAAVADFLDGYLARAWNQKTVLGTYLDPIGDKVLVGGLLLTLGYHGSVHPALVSLVVFRDLALIMGTFFILNKAMRDSPDGRFDFKSLEVRPSLLSKANTLLQFSLVGLVITYNAWGIPDNHQIIDAVSWVTAATTFGSGLSYFISHIRGSSALQFTQRWRERLSKAGTSRQSKRE